MHIRVIFLALLVSTITGCWSSRISRGNYREYPFYELPPYSSSRDALFVLTLPPCAKESQIREVLSANFRMGYEMDYLTSQKDLPENIRVSRSPGTVYYTFPVRVKGAGVVGIQLEASFRKRDLSTEGVVFRISPKEYPAGQVHIFELACPAEKKITLHYETESVEKFRKRPDAIPDNIRGVLKNPQ
ncbi:MAG TPA: hypothetical protein PLG78_01385 [Leptospiraceae bacterium]|nr:hypothetical protein [Leptospiraceae bacterium]